MDLNHYDCATAAGLGVEALMQGLYGGIDHSTKIIGNEWDRPAIPGGRVCFLSDVSRKNFHYHDHIILHFEKLWNQFCDHLPENLNAKLKSSRALLLFSSTKGTVEDYIWDVAKDSSELREHEDPFYSMVKDLQRKISAKVDRLDSLVVSGACTSSHVAFQTAKRFLDQDAYDVVFVVAADLIGPFIYQGFNSLKILTPERNKPFAKDRDGLQLGEAVAFFLFSKGGWADEPKAQILNVATETEGGSVTRPSVNGESLSRVINLALKNVNADVDFFVAHGTGTRFNDAAEASALGQHNKLARILAIKWSVGHCLGASGALDLIVACEVLRRKKYFEIKNSTMIDSSFPGTYGGSKLSLGRLAVVTSLGFGGIHGALAVRGVT